MRSQYGKTDYAKEHLTLERCESLEAVLRRIPVDYANYNVDDMGSTLLRIFLHPQVGSKFTNEQVRQLRTIMNSTFNIINKVPDEKDEYGRNQHIWVKDMRPHSGEVHWVRILKNHYQDADLFILIENAELGQCKLVKTEVTQTVFEMDCSKEKT